MVPLKHGGSTVSIICGLTECLLQFQFNPQLSFAGSIVLAKHITVALQGNKYNHVKIGRYEEIRVHFHQILMDNNGGELQPGGEFNSEGASLQNAELSQIRHVEKQTHSGRYGIKKSNFTWTILFLNWDLLIFPLSVETDSTLITSKLSPWSWWQLDASKTSWARRCHLGHSRKCLIVFLFSIRDHIPAFLSFTATSAHETQHRVSNPNKQRVPGGPCYNAQLFSASPCKGVAAAREEGMCWSTGWQPAGSPPPRTDVTSPGHSSTGWPGSLLLSLLIPPSPYKNLQVAGCHSWRGQASRDRWLVPALPEENMSHSESLTQLRVEEFFP